MVKCLFVCLSVCLFLFVSSEYTYRKIFWKFYKKSDLIWLQYYQTKKIFVCLSVWLFLFFDFFCLNHLGIPTYQFHESFVKIGFDLAEVKDVFFISLFVCSHLKREGGRVSIPLKKRDIYGKYFLIHLSMCYNFQTIIP